MLENVSNVKAIVEYCLTILVKSYEGKKHIEDFLTESDVASSLFCMLKDEMKKQNMRDFKVHSGLRPFIEEKTSNLVIKVLDSLSGEWKKHEPKNSGSVVDIVIINKRREFFEKAKDVSPKKYWRLVTYPLEAFKVCIEVKIRVSGNIKRIKKDVMKLRKIRETNRSCLVYLVVVDRKAPNRGKENIKGYCDKNGVPLYIAFPSHQT